MNEKTAVILTVILIIALSTTASHVYSELHLFGTSPEYTAPLTFPNETPGLFYVRYFTNASRVLLLFEKRENAEKFASFIQNSSVVITSDGTHADVLMKREVLSKILELADYSDVTRVPIDPYWNPQRLEKEYQDLKFLLANYSFPEPIRGYLLDRFRERSEDMEKISQAKNFMLAHKELEFYEIELIEPSHGMEYLNLSSDLAVILLAEMVLIALAVFERDRRRRALFLISFLLLTVPTYEFATYESQLKNHEGTIRYILGISENSTNRTLDGLNGSVDISCYVRSPREVENLIGAINSSEILKVEHSLRGRWLCVSFISDSPQRLLRMDKCSLSTYGYNCRRRLTEEERQVINKTEEVLKRIPKDKGYLVEWAISIYNSTVHTCPEVPGLPPGKYLTNLWIFPEEIYAPDLWLIIQILVSAVAVLFAGLLLPEK